MSQQRGAARMWWTYSRDETVQALAELEAIGERLGGGFIVTPIRKRVVQTREDGQDVPANDPSGKPLYQTVAWCFKHESFMPAVDPSRTAPVPLQTEVTEEEIELHFPEPPMQPPVGDVIEGEPIPGDPTEGLTEEEIAANRAARTGDGDPDAADAVVGAGDGRTQS